MHFRRGIKRNVSVKELLVCVTMSVPTIAGLNMSSGISKWRVYFLGNLAPAGIRRRRKSGFLIRPDLNTRVDVK